MSFYVNKNKKKNNQDQNNRKKKKNKFKVQMMHKWQVLGGRKKPRCQAIPLVSMAIRK